MADRILGIEKKIFTESVIPYIDKTKFLGLDNSNSRRIELFLFALAIGVKENKKTPLTAFHGVIRESSINPNDMAKIYTVLVHELRKTNEEEKIGDKDLAFQVAQEYANTGFLTIQKWLDNLDSKDEETVLWDLILELDEKFSQIFPNAT